jgi:hypothetical protein
MLLVFYVDLKTFMSSLGLFYVMRNDKDQHVGNNRIGTYFAVIVLAIITTSSLLTATMLVVVAKQEAYAQGADTWYVGKGAKENTYYTYKIQDHDTNQGQPFTMTIYFKDFNAQEGYWIAPVYIVDKGKVINGTFHLSDRDLTALGSSQIPPEMNPYRSAYKNSLQWLAAYVPKPGQSLTAPYWGKIASIGGSPIAPGGAAKVTVPAGTYDSTVVSYHKGVDNNIWVNNNLPYPVKAETFADVTTGNPPLQYAYDLQATGQGQPPAPQSQIEIPKPPLELQTQRGSYYMVLVWDPQPLVAGKPAEFGILFMNNAKSPVTDVRYGFKATDSDGAVITDLKNQKADDGTGRQKLTFDKEGPKEIEVTVEAVGPNPMGEFIESADFGVVVAPSSTASS